MYLILCLSITVVYTFKACSCLFLLWWFFNYFDHIFLHCHYMMIVLILKVTQKILLVNYTRILQWVSNVFVLPLIYFNIFYLYEKYTYFILVWTFETAVTIRWSIYVKLSCMLLWTVLVRFSRCWLIVVWMKLSSWLVVFIRRDSVTTNLLPWVSISYLFFIILNLHSTI